MEIVSKIIEYINDELRISHRIIAEKTDNLEKSVRNIITKYKSDFEEFGQVHFKNATVRNSVGAVNEQITYFLNEQQSTLQSDKKSVLKLKIVFLNSNGNFQF